LFTLRNVPNFLPTFVTNDVTYDLSSAFKWLKVNSDSLKIMVIGNFDVIAATSTVTFQNAGTWYNYLSGGTRIATGGAETITLQPGEYYVYVNKDVNNLVTALPLKLMSFGATPNSNNITLAWLTANEVNVKEFVIERSFDGLEFNAIASVSARNVTMAELQYSYIDKDVIAVENEGKVYYRLRMVDIDGKFSYSNIAVVNPNASAAQFFVYPNPATGSEVYVELKEEVQSDMNISIEDVNGRVYNRYKVNKGNVANAIPVNIKSIANGVYILKIETPKKRLIQQIIIQR